MERLTKEEVNNFALKNKVTLSDSELAFTYAFVKKNWKVLLANPNSFHFERYKDKFSEENFGKINRLIKEYLSKYQGFL